MSTDPPPVSLVNHRRSLSSLYWARISIAASPSVPQHQLPAGTQPGPTLATLATPQPIRGRGQVIPPRSPAGDDLN